MASSRPWRPFTARVLDDLAALGEVSEHVHDMEGPLSVVGDLPCPEPEDLAVAEQDNAVFHCDADRFGGQLRAASASWIKYAVS